MTIEKPQETHFHDLFRLDWLLQIWARPGEVFKWIVSQTSRVWLTSLIVMSMAALAYGMVNGGARQPELAMSAEPGDGLGFEEGFPEGGEFGEDFDFPQEGGGLEGNTGPTPASPITGLFQGLFPFIRVWVSWLIIAGALYLSFTMSGGRIDGPVARNLVAWAGLPLALRSVIRTAAVLVTSQPISNPGLAGFAPINAGGPNILAATFLSIVDIYLLWSIVWLIIGGKEVSGWAYPKTVRAVGIPLFILILLQAGVSYGGTVISQQITAAFSSGF